VEAEGEFLHDCPKLGNLGQPRMALWPKGVRYSASKMSSVDTVWPVVERGGERRQNPPRRCAGTEYGVTLT